MKILPAAPEGKTRRVFANRPQLADTETRTGELVRLIVDHGNVVDAVVIQNPQPWVYRRAYLVPSDVV